MPIFDIAISVALLNFLAMLGNLYFSLQLKQTQTNKEIVGYWKEEYNRVSRNLEEVTSSRDNFKKQYELILHEQQRLNGHVCQLEKIHDILGITPAEVEGRQV